MSNILTQNTRGSSDGSTNSTVREPMKKAFELATEMAESGGTQSRDGRAYLIIDLGTAMGSLLGGSKATGGKSEQTTMQTSGSQSNGKSGGSGTLSKVFLLGAIVGLGYVMRKRSESMDEVVSKATDRARKVADETAMRSGEMAGHTETASQEAAERIQETGETAAEQIQGRSEKAAEQVEKGTEKAAEQVEKGGEQAADEMEAAGETVEKAEEKAEEKVEEKTGEGEEESKGSEE